MGTNPYAHDVDDQRNELVAALTAAFDDAGACSPERLAQVAIEVVCDNTVAALDVISFEDDWIAEMRAVATDDDGTFGTAYDYRTPHR